MYIYTHEEYLIAKTTSTPDFESYDDDHYTARPQILAPKTR
jgi:hypothetical protein